MNGYLSSSLYDDISLPRILFLCYITLYNIIWYYVTLKNIIWNDILSLPYYPQRETTDADALESTPKSPLEHLEDVLSEIPNDQSYILKRELLIGVVSDSSKTLRDTGVPSM